MEVCGRLGVGSGAFHDCASLAMARFPAISKRAKNLIKAGQHQKMKNVPYMPPKIWVKMSHIWDNFARHHVPSRYIIFESHIFLVRAYVILSHYHIP